MCQNSFFEKITPATAICDRGKSFYLGINLCILTILNRLQYND
ncbi:hypothetical protein HMPREF1535_04744 [Parabacteroides goldsteinii DSM 19448 = WAL 12034]|uniref:Uncharacterized protein n=1 Tax=Parabacteroides goldsteinii DSM 19448 = WAL 12034 TaxID=927665 RepID=A0A0F5IP35_9BACT|nr:hypothetical protein HMPREF1535_04744 [Parabacteroides goldsteinii DSM 19448 = WAL 12034]